MKRRGWIAAGLILGLAVAGAGVLMVRARTPFDLPLSLPIGQTDAPADARIRVQVLNASRVPGLARRATQFLRDRGFDVVEMGTSRELRDSTLVLDRSSNAEWARAVAEALDAPVSARPDTSRYLDVTVLVGATWRPPAESFHP